MLHPKAAVKGTGFGPMEEVKIYWSDPQTLLGTATANAKGTFNGGATFTFTVPSAAPSGVNYVEAKGETSGAEVRATITVQ